jgi:serine/threonine protein kinase/tetratricopeptide (TPR) repeat protein
VADIAVQLGDALRDRYLIERELGRGGMATVYLAQDLKHDRPVALKVLHPELAATLGPERFLREIRLTARLDHPHILPVHDSGEAQGLLWYTMPYVEGESLRDRLRREEQLPLEDAVRVAREVAEALDYAHRHGVVHRDIKPENVLLGEGHARVADFGVAQALGAAGAGRLTETGLVVGTPVYMSPEQASGGQVDARSDVYSLGCVLYEMMAGEPPYSGPTAQALIAKRFSDPVPSARRVREAVPEALDRAVMKALAKVPADRIQTAAELARLLSATQQSGLGAANISAATAIPQPDQATLPRRSRVGPRAAVLLLGFLIAATMGMLLWRRGHPSGAAPDTAIHAPNSPRATDGEQPSVAVLPFTNLSSDRENEYFSDGMTEELIIALSRVEGLRVAARASSFAFKGKPLDVAEVSRKLNVSAVLDGSIRRAGRRLRVTAELVRASDGVRLWAESYDRELRDVFAVQDDLARAIARALTPRLGPTVSVPPGGQHTVDLEAYDLYLRGRYAWSRRTEEGLDDARRLFEQAIARDSLYTQAYAGLADLYLSLPNWTPTRPNDVLPRAESLAVKAIALDNTLAEPHATLGAVLANYHYDWSGAQREITRAIALNPSSPTAQRYLVLYYLLPQGRLNEALQVAQTAVAHDPLSTAANQLLGVILYYTGHPNEAIAQLQKTLRSDPNFGQGALYANLALAYLVNGRYREAIATYHQGISTGRLRSSPGGLGVAYAHSGQRREALQVLSDLEAEAKRQYVRPGDFAAVYLGLGDTNSAFIWYQRACTEHAYSIFGFPAGQFTRSLRGDPRGAAILRCMHLAATP